MGAHRRRAWRRREGSWWEGSSVGELEEEDEVKGREVTCGSHLLFGLQATWHAHVGKSGKLLKPSPKKGKKSKYKRAIG